MDICVVGSVSIKETGIIGEYWDADYSVNIFIFPSLSPFFLEGDKGIKYFSIVAIFINT